MMIIIGFTNIILLQVRLLSAIIPLLLLVIMKVQENNSFKLEAAKCWDTKPTLLYNIKGIFTLTLSSFLWTNGTYFSWCLWKKWSNGLRILEILQWYHVSCFTHIVTVDMKMIHYSRSQITPLERARQPKPQVPQSTSLLPHGENSDETRAERPAAQSLSNNGTSSFWETLRLTHRAVLPVVAPPGRWEWQDRRISRSCRRRNEDPLGGSGSPKASPSGAVPPAGARRSSGGSPTPPPPGPARRRSAARQRNSGCDANARPGRREIESNDHV